MGPSITQSRPQMTTPTKPAPDGQVRALLQGLTAELASQEPRKPARWAATRTKATSVAEAAPIAPAARARLIADDYNEEAASMMFIEYDFI